MKDKYVSQVYHIKSIEGIEEVAKAREELYEKYDSVKTEMQGDIYLYFMCENH